MTWVVLILAGIFCACVLAALERIGNRLLRITEVLESPEPKLDPPSINIRRKRWEYRLVTPHWRKDRMRFVYHVNEEIDEDLTEVMMGRDTYMVMNELGAEGWEFVDLFFIDNTESATHPREWNYIFKRQLGDMM